jgi:hypothetical protein
MKKASILKLFAPLVCAPFFGAAYWAFLERFQTAFVNAIHGTCCERCANILYDREQIPLAVCAALAFALAGLVNTKGWKGILKTLALVYLSFQIYSLLVAWSVMQAEECTALHRVRAFPLLSFAILIIYLLFLSGFWATLCAAPIVVFNLFRRLVLNGKDDGKPLDMGLK